MANDSTQVSSLRYGDEDFDFDFDLSVPPENEETALEDAISVDLSVVSESNLSPAACSSLMADDSYCSYDMDHMRLWKAEIEQDKEYDSLSVVTEIESNPDRIDRSTFRVKDGEVPKHPALQDNMKATEKSLQIVGTEEKPLGKYEQQTEDYAKSPSNNSLHDSETYHPGNVDTRSNATSDELSCSQLPSTKDCQDNDRISVTRLSPETVSDSSHHEPVWSEPELTDEKIGLTNVIICYQSNQYALFSSADSDDPNSYFISDRSVIQKPLSELFKAIHDVLYEDLGDEGELYISISDFGLQIEEVSSSLEQITLSQIIMLHSKLLLNDGIDTIQPMYIDLGIRKNFLKGLLKLTAVAKEGKGLSELAASDECGKDFKYSEDDEDISCRFQGKLNGCAKPNEQQFNHDSHQCSELDPHVAKLADNSAEGNARGVTDLEQEFYIDTSRSIEPEEIISPISRSSTGVPDEDRKPSKFKSANSDDSFVCGFDEDGDMIDYSEDESEECFTLTKNTTALANNDGNIMRGTYNGILFKCDSSCEQPDLNSVESHETNESLGKKSDTQATEGNTIQQKDEDLSIGENIMSKKLEIIGYGIIDENNDENQENSSEKTINYCELDESYLSECIDDRDAHSELVLLAKEGDEIADQSPKCKVGTPDQTTGYQENIATINNEHPQEMDEDQTCIPTRNNITRDLTTDVTSSHDSVGSWKVCLDECSDPVSHKATMESVVNSDPNYLRVEDKAGNLNDVDLEVQVEDRAEDEAEAESSDEIDYEDEGDEITLLHLEDSTDLDITQPDPKIMSQVNKKRIRGESGLEMTVGNLGAKRHRPS